MLFQGLPTPFQTLAFVTDMHVSFQNSRGPKKSGGQHFSDVFVTIPYWTRSCFFSGNCVSPYAGGRTKPRLENYSRPCPGQEVLPFFLMKQLQSLIILWALPDLLSHTKKKKLISPSFTIPGATGMVLVD